MHGISYGFLRMTNDSVRPTKKQREMLVFIDSFIKEHGYSPSYREIMSGLNYNSVATVALHVGNLIKRGHLQKRDYSARSLEVVSISDTTILKSNQIKPGEEKWLVEKIEYFISDLEHDTSVSQSKIDELYVLIGALRVLGLEGAAQSFIPRLSVVKKRIAS